MDSLIWYTGIFRIKSGILESSQESRNPAKIPKDSESCRRKFIVSGPSELLSFDRKSELDSLTSPQEKIKHFLDAILIPGLNAGYTGHFDEMVVMMKENDDVLVKFLIEKLVPDVSVASSSAGASSAALTANTGIKDCNKFLFQDLFLSIWCCIESSSCGCTL